MTVPRSDSPVGIDMGLHGTGFQFNLLRSKRRTLEIAVTDRGQVEVRAPLDLPIERIEARVRARSRWIRSRLFECELARPHVTTRIYRGGETHRYLGRQYRLLLSRGRPSTVSASSGRLHVTVADPADSSSVKRALDHWFHAQARVLLPSRLRALLALPAIRGVEPCGIRIQRMRLRWGSCTASGRILLNTELVRLPVTLIDYVVVHELCHLLVARHDSRFERLLSRAMPDWNQLHARLIRQRLD